MFSPLQKRWHLQNIFFLSLLKLYCDFIIIILNSLQVISFRQHDRNQDTNLGHDKSLQLRHRPTHISLTLEMFTHYKQKAALYLRYQQYRLLKKATKQLVFCIILKRINVIHYLTFNYNSFKRASKHFKSSSVQPNGLFLLCHQFHLSCTSFQWSFFWHICNNL